jgi:hypothetical protein
MSIRDLLQGIKPRTKTVKLTEDKSVTLHELSTTARMLIEKERLELVGNEDTTTRDLNENVAKVVVMSMLGIEEKPSKEDIEDIFEMLGLEQLNDLFTEALKFSGLDGESASDAKKN